MKKLILITLILLLHSFPSFGDPNGKGVVCGCDDCKEPPWEFGIWFNKNEVEMYLFYQRGTTIKNNIDKKSQQVYPFFHNVDVIKWNRRYLESDFSYELNRENLILTEKFKGVFNGENTRQCVVFSDRELLKDQLDKLKKIYQTEIDNKMKKNKI